MFWKDSSPGPSTPKFLDIFQHEMVEKIGMLHHDVIAPIAVHEIRKFPILFPSAVASSAEVFREGVHIKKSDQ